MQVRHAKMFRRLANGVQLVEPIRTSWRDRSAVHEVLNAGFRMEDLVFMMGKYEARFPQDRLYTTNHLWLKSNEQQPNTFNVGFTAYSIRLLRDIYFIDWSIDAGTKVVAKQEIGQVESSKALSSMYPPCGGVIVAFNDAILSDPALINADNYGAGWLYQMQTNEPLISPEDYLVHLSATWDDTQRMIQKQVNQQ